MARSQAMKRRRVKRPRFHSAIALLPNELVIQVLGRVAAASHTDLFNAKLSCKLFHEVSDDTYVYQQVSLERFPVVPWPTSEQASSFFEKCKECGNPEALYRQGLIEYFDHMRLELGLQCIKRAANLGHVEASYILGIILLCSGEEFRQQAIQLLDSIRNSRVTKVGECRKKLKATLRGMWVMNKLNPKQKPMECKMRDQHKRTKGWSTEDDDDLHCQACGFDCEVGASYFGMGKPVAQTPLTGLTASP
ncbi:hypothetical protein L1049_020641 [Liquidambar formosana]|uniref:F-box protein n=1 Tax=Liquidambar formosana TaxID=63359 RepID=A0AAP0SA81_LIQFO